MSISLEKAQEIVAEHSEILQSVALPLEQCLEGILAEDVIATMNQPPFRRSTMDGYAVRKEDVRNSLDSETLPLKVIREIDAGDQREFHIGSYEAARIMTGAKVPEGADMVIPQEQSDFGLGI